jgi:hypothetical protein
MFDPVSLSVYPEQYPEPGMQDMLFWMLDQVGAFLAWLPLWVRLLILAILIVTGCAVISLAGWKWIAATRRQDVDAAREAVRMLKDFFGVCSFLRRRLSALVHGEWYLVGWIGSCRSANYCNAGYVFVVENRT